MGKLDRPTVIDLIDTIGGLRAKTSTPWRGAAAGADEANGSALGGPPDGRADQPALFRQNECVLVHRASGIRSHGRSSCRGVVEGVALHQCATERCHDRTERFLGHLLAVECACRSADVLVHQRAAEVVDSGLQ